MTNVVQRSRFARSSGGYLIVLFVIIVAFTGVAAAMQVLVLTSVATTSRAYDSYRQGAAEMGRFERCVSEALMDECQISVAPPPASLTDAINSRLGQMTTDGATVSIATIPTAAPVIATFPSTVRTPDPLDEVPMSTQLMLSAQTGSMVGPRAAVYPELTFEFSSTRTVLDAARTYKTSVKASVLAAPLTRFPLAAYDLPAEIGSSSAAAHPVPPSALPAGAVPSRDSAFIADLQSQPGILPYHFRHRASLAAAYQYVFSQAFVDRVAEYAGITHYRNLDAATGTASLAGMSVSGGTTDWDLGIAGNGTYGTITLNKDAAVVFTEQAGQVLHLHDSSGNANSPAMLLLLLGPSDSSLGYLTVDVATIVRPVVIIGYNVRVTAAVGTALSGALLLDPSSALAPAAPITVGHLSYWSGSAAIPANAVAVGPLPAAAESIAPRVVYVATSATRL